jgi:hypothetical protein
VNTKEEGNMQTNEIKSKAVMIHEYIRIIYEHNLTRKTFIEECLRVEIEIFF